MTELTTDRVTRLEAYKDALDAADVEYDTHVTYRIEIEENSSDAASVDTSDETHIDNPPLPSGGKSRKAVEFVGKHHKEWVTESDIPDEYQYDTGAKVLTQVWKYNDCLKRKNLSSSDEMGELLYGYRLKEPYRRELTGQAIDVEALTEARNA